MKTVSWAVSMINRVQRVVLLKMINQRRRRCRSLKRGKSSQNEAATMMKVIKQVPMSQTQRPQALRRQNSLCQWKVAEDSLVDRLVDSLVDSLETNPEDSLVGNLWHRLKNKKRRNLKRNRVANKNSSLLLPGWTSQLPLQAEAMYVGKILRPPQFENQSSQEPHLTLSSGYSRWLRQTPLKSRNQDREETEKKVSVIKSQIMINFKSMKVKKTKKKWVTY